MGAVRLTVVRDESEADVVCGLLRLEGIQCFHRGTDVTADATIPSLAGWREILVNDLDVPRARELLEPADPAPEQCIRCGHDIGETGRWYRTESGDIEPYCAVCAERLFGPF